MNLEKCKSCGKTFDIEVKRSNANREYCADCAPAARKEARLAKRDNDWIEQAREQGIPLWEQQPGESNEEYELWTTYRDLWPDERPTVTKVSRLSAVGVGTVQRAYNTWTWAARLQSWIREVTAEQTASLRRAKREMVEDHVAMGKLMREKAMQAIDGFDPYDVTPNELVAILKETQRLESSGREMLDEIDRATAADVDMVTAPDGLFLTEDEAAQQESNMQQGRLGAAELVEVAAILAAAGVLKVNGAPTTVSEPDMIEVEGYDM